MVSLEENHRQVVSFDDENSRDVPLSRFDAKSQVLEQRKQLL